MSEIAVDNNDLETQKQIKSISRWCEDKIAKKDEAKAKFDETFSKFPGAAMDASQIRTFYDRIITMAWAELIEYVNLH